MRPKANTAETRSFFLMGMRRCHIAHTGMKNMTTSDKTFTAPVTIEAVNSKLDLSTVYSVVQ